MLAGRETSGPAAAHPTRERRMPIAESFIFLPFFPQDGCEIPMQSVVYFSGYFYQIKTRRSRPFLYRFSCMDIGPKNRCAGVRTSS